MIIHKLILHHLRRRDDQAFYELQARDAVEWLKRQGAPLSSAATALDLGCGMGLFGRELMAQGMNVTFADERNLLMTELRDRPFKQINIDIDSLASLGRYDLVICSNVLEHLSQPKLLIDQAADLLKPNGYFYLSWTNWLSPWGGHEFSPLHYLGPRLGPRLYDKLTGKKRFHTPGVNLFPTNIGTVLNWIRRNDRLRIEQLAPRYYPEFSLLMKIPVARELLAWNCAVLISATPGGK